MTVFRLCSITVEDSIGNDLQNEAYQYDEVGNRTGTELGGQEWSYNANHELLDYGTEGNQVTFEYDEKGSTVKKTTVMDDGSAGNAGAVTSEDVEIYVYNIAGRLSEVQRNGTTIAQYYYDPFGRRLYKDVSGIKTYFLYSDEGLIGEYSTTGSLKQSYQYFPNHYWGTKPLALIENGEAYYYQHDQLGTPNLLTSKSGETQWKGRVDAHGQMHSTASKRDNPLRFPGQYEDSETGNHYNYFRDYNPQTGRYLQSDPVGLYGGINTYVYAGTNPANYIDPIGLDYGFAVDPNAAGGNGHTSLFFQDYEGNWYQFDQGAAGENSSGDIGFLTSSNVEGGVTIRPIKTPPEGTQFYPSSSIRDALITQCAIESQKKHANGELEYDLYNNNCTDAAVDVLSCAGIDFYNPAFTVKPNTWFEDMQNEKPEEEDEYKTIYKKD